MRVPPTSHPNTVFELLCIPTYYKYFSLFIHKKHPHKFPEFLTLVEHGQIRFDSLNDEFGMAFDPEFEEYRKTVSYRRIAGFLKEDANVFSIGVDRE